jgi:ubiquinone/menaquinone biosynthesis C-methylase UbiE
MPPTDDTVRQSYDAMADEYDRRWAGYVDGSTRETLVRTPVAPEDRMLDVACGTGVLLSRLLDDHPQVTAHGVDLSANMLRQARHRLPESVDLREADAQSLPFDDGSFDLVVSANAFHYFEAPLAALAEFRRVLAPGGRLVITDWCTDFWITWLCERILTVVDPGHGYAYDTDRLADFLAAADFAVERLDRYRIQWQWGLMTAVASRD